MFSWFGQSWPWQLRSSSCNWFYTKFTSTCSVEVVPPPPPPIASNQNIPQTLPISPHTPLSNTSPTSAMQYPVSTSTHEISPYNGVPSFQNLLYSMSNGSYLARNHTSDAQPQYTFQYPSFSTLFSTPTSDKWPLAPLMFVWKCPVITCAVCRFISVLRSYFVSCVQVSCAVTYSTILSLKLHYMYE